MEIFGQLTPEEKVEVRMPPVNIVGSNDKRVTVERNDVFTMPSTMRHICPYPMQFAYIKRETDGTFLLTIPPNSPSWATETLSWDPPLKEHNGWLICHGTWCQPRESGRYVFFTNEAVDKLKKVFCALADVRPYDIAPPAGFGFEVYKHCYEVEGGW